MDTGFRRHDNAMNNLLRFIAAPLLDIFLATTAPVPEAPMPAEPAASGPLNQDAITKGLGGKK